MKKEAIKLIALPLTKSSLKKDGLIYLYHHNPNLNPTSSSSTSTQPERKAWVHRITDFGAKQWLKMGTATQSNWKYKVYITGERLMDKIPFEEWAMKSIEPLSLPTHLPNLNPNDHHEKPKSASIDPIELLYPSLLGPSEKLLEWLKTSMIEREPYHRKWMKYNLLISPFTLPFAILPVVPNLPFLYLMWRTWSHWRAYRATKYLNTMISHGLIIPRESKILNQIYDPSVLMKEESGMMILNREMVLRMKEEFQWNETCEREIERAIHQADLRLKEKEKEKEMGKEKMS